MFTDAVQITVPSSCRLFSARQFVNHGHVTVNGKKVTSRLTASKKATSPKFATALAERGRPDAIGLKETRCTDRRTING
jgi:hypothetical protein